MYCLVVTVLKSTNYSEKVGFKNQIVVGCCIRQF